MCLLCAAAAASAANPAWAKAATAAASSAKAAGSGSPAYIVASFVHPVLFSVMGLKVYSYGTLVAAALGTAFMVFGSDLRRAGIDLDELSCFFVFLAGFAIGSKGHLALSAVGAGEELSWKSLDITTGHSFIGSQIGAVLFMLAYIKWHRVGTLQFLDVLLPCCLLGHAIGKIGCFLSGDGCYGPPANPVHVPWAMSFPNASVPTREPVHPTPIYETICSFAVFVITRWAKNPAVEHGDSKGFALPVKSRTALVLALYGIERVLIEQFRRHPPIHFFGGLTEYQMLAVCLLLIGAAIEAWVRWTSGTTKSVKQA